MVGDLLIKIARAGDEALLARLNESVQELHVARHPDIFRPSDRPEVEAWFGTLLNDPAARAWIAFRAGTPVGYVLVQERRRPQTPLCWERLWFELEQICVLPEHRRQGVARALSDEAKRYAAARGAAYMTVESWVFNASGRATFEHLGFEPMTVRFRSALPALGSGSG